MESVFGRKRFSKPGRPFQCKASVQKGHPNTAYRPRFKALSCVKRTKFKFITLEQAFPGSRADSDCRANRTTAWCRRCYKNSQSPTQYALPHLLSSHTGKRNYPRFNSIIFLINGVMNVDQNPNIEGNLNYLSDLAIMQKAMSLTLTNTSCPFLHP